MLKNRPSGGFSVGFSGKIPDVTESKKMIIKTGLLLLFIRTSKQVSQLFRSSVYARPEARIFPRIVKEESVNGNAGIRQSRKPRRHRNLFPIPCTGMSRCVFLVRKIRIFLTFKSNPIELVRESRSVAVAYSCKGEEKIPNVHDSG